MARSPGSISTSCACCRLARFSKIRTDDRTSIGLAAALLRQHIPEGEAVARRRSGERASQGAGGYRRTPAGRSTGLPVERRAPEVLVPRLILGGGGTGRTGGAGGSCEI